ncbi:IS200/IS605 family transposase [Mycolicibacterium sphagni]|uniref:IS200/IS605 family transposase n=1 Tax=Mycolicibacterium sphagni TaxID=1786 RepID=A0A255DYS5_9MYCO|nr:IS200/IS605 family transposase [Mycolicibacterium sphagni]OYN82435.1 IS200/IS605 family transposase [Mycolicibacterium sphagni]
MRVPLRTSEKVTHRCIYQVVWCPQYRAPVISKQIEARLRTIIEEVVAEKNGCLLALHTAPTYVHLTVEVPPQLGIHRLIKAMKATSAQQLRAEFPTLRTRLPSLWTNSYLVMTAGGTLPHPLIEHYLAQQKTRR